MAEPPDVQTARLSFYRQTAADFAEKVALWADPETTRYIGGTPRSASETWSRLVFGAGHWAIFGFGFWLVRETATGRHAGEVGFKHAQPDLDGGGDTIPEIGWAFAPWAKRQGFATEAALGALAWGEARFGWTRTCCLMDADNAGSRRVAEKCGYTLCARIDHGGKPSLVLSRPRGGP
jgi:RimJ/RimL family protein N-acetyltransferase